MKRFFTLGLTTLLCACTNHELYDAVQTSQRHECITLAEPLQKECFERYDMSYEDYKRERDGLKASPFAEPAK